MSEAADLLAQAWALLGDGAARRNMGANRPVLATVGPDGAPEARTLVMRHADRAAGTLVFFTDAASGKVASLRARPEAAVHLWDEETALQLRIALTVAVVTGPEAEPWWREVPPARRDGYGVAPAPGTEIAGPLDYARHADRALFAALVGTVTGIEVLHLGDVHRRARFVRRDGWQGHWLAP